MHLQVENLEQIIEEAKQKAAIQLKFAEEYLDSDLSSVMAKTRLISEIITDGIFVALSLEYDKKMDQNSKINRLKEIHFDRNITDMLDFIRIKGNKAVHEGFATEEDSQKALYYVKQLIDNISDVTEEFYVANWEKKLLIMQENRENAIPAIKHIEELHQRAKELEHSLLRQEIEIKKLERKNKDLDSKKVKVDFEDLITPGFIVTYLIYFIGIFTVYSKIIYESWSEGFTHLTNNLGIFAIISIVAAILALILLGATHAFIPLMVTAILKLLLVIYNLFPHVLKTENRKKAMELAIKNGKAQYQEKINSFNLKEKLPYHIVVNPEIIERLKGPLIIGEVATLKEAAKLYSYPFNEPLEKEEEEIKQDRFIEFLIQKEKDFPSRLLTELYQSYKVHHLNDFNLRMERVVKSVAYEEVLKVVVNLCSENHIKLRPEEILLIERELLDNQTYPVLYSLKERIPGSS